jgi:hypothetical protein
LVSFEKVSKDSKWVNKSVSLKYIDLGMTKQRLKEMGIE